MSSTGDGAAGDGRPVAAPAVASIFVRAASDGLPGTAHLRGSGRADLVAVGRLLESGDVVWRRWDALWEAVVAWRSEAPPDVVALLDRVAADPHGRRVLRDAGVLLPDEVTVVERR